MSISLNVNFTARVWQNFKFWIANPQTARSQTIACKNRPFVGQKFPNDEKHFRISFMAYEARKVFAIRKMKTQFTNKNTHILRTNIFTEAVP